MQALVFMVVWGGMVVAYGRTAGTTVQGIDGAAGVRLTSLTCLALNVYWEARSESVEGQLAVASVTLNRVAHRGFPDSVCGVVTQGGARRLNQCQFSWWCDGRDDTPTDDKAWERAGIVAWLAASRAVDDPTQGALFYHADYVEPVWSRGARRFVQIDRHRFYRQVKGFDPEAVARVEVPTPTPEIEPPVPDPTFSLASVF